MKKNTGRVGLSSRARKHIRSERSLSIRFAQRASRSDRTADSPTAPKGVRAQQESRSWPKRVGELSGEGPQLLAALVAAETAALVLGFGLLVRVEGTTCRRESVATMQVQITINAPEHGVVIRLVASGAMTLLELRRSWRLVPVQARYFPRRTRRLP